MPENTSDNLAKHDHQHGFHRLAVLPTPLRLDADPEATGRGVVIALLDSGFYPHPDLTKPINRIIAFEDVTQPGASLQAEAVPHDGDWHGTQTSVVAAGNGYLSEAAYRAIAWNAEVVLVKVGVQGRITEENIARGIQWVVENKDRYAIRVVSISLGGDDDISYKQSIADQAAEEAVSKGLVVVVAAGNAGCTEKHRPIPPANSPSVITVGGYDDKNKLGQRDFALYCSNFGPTTDGIIKPEIIAPAIWIAAPILPHTASYKKAEALSILAAAPDYRLTGLARGLWQEADLPESIQDEPPEVIRALVESSLRENKYVATHYQHVDGTSFAAPIVASVIAQMLEVNPNLTPGAVKHLLISTADRIREAPIMRQGYGVLNARRAVEQARQERHCLDHEHLRPPRVEQGKLVFLLHNDRAQRVSLAADFNNWDPTHTPLSRDASGFWRAEIDPPPPGRYRYKFVIDGQRWMEDPSNGLQEPDGFNGLNSVLNIT
jgi:serine protease AprX